MEIETLSNSESSFERVREQPGCVWRKIKKSVAFQKVFQCILGIGTTIAFFAVILPLSLVLVGINILGLLILGLSTPALAHQKGAKVWKIFKNKLLGLLSDLAALPKAALITPFAFQTNSSFAVEEEKDKIVVFVHGFLHNKTCWGSLSKKLQKETRQDDSPITEKDIYSINLGAPITVNSIETYARFLATKLEQIRKRRNVETLNVVFDCHSMGGLVAGVFATQFAKEVNVKVLRLIANGTPWHGTPMAKLGSWAQCGKEMVPGHLIQTTLQNQIEEMSDKIFTIASKGDTIVPFPSAQGIHLPIPENNRIALTSPFGHLAMLGSSQATQENIRLIKEAWAQE